MLNDNTRREALVDLLMAGPGAPPRSVVREAVDIGEHAAQQGLDLLTRICGNSALPIIALNIALKTLERAQETLHERAAARYEELEGLQGLAGDLARAGLGRVVAHGDGFTVIELGKDATDGND